jgi:pentapeptide MXKDX repeat protein
LPSDGGAHDFTRIPAGQVNGAQAKALRSQPLARPVSAVALTFGLMLTPAAFAQDKTGTMGNDTTSKDAMSNGTMSKDTMGKDAMSKDAMGKDTMAKDSMKKDEMKK